ncbi:MAG: glycosyltransferase family A protein [Candidatus Sericytochromatia bacterium]
MNTPLISVIIPLFNCEKYICESIGSILNQNYPDLEIIIVNDGSTDNYLEQIENFKNIKLLSQENKGVSAARNRGIQEAKGDIIGFLDADDLWSDNYISSLLKYLINDDNYQISRGRTKMIKLINNNEFKEINTLFHPFLVGSALYKKSVFYDVGFFDELIKSGEDIDLVNRIKIHSNIKEKAIEDICLIYRRHETNMTKSPDDIKKAIFDVIRKNIQRK